MLAERSADAGASHSLGAQAIPGFSQDCRQGPGKGFANLFTRFGPDERRPVIAMAQKRRPQKRSAQASSRGAGSGSRASPQPEQPPKVDAAWKELSAEYPGHPALTGGTVYSLPLGLIDEIQRAVQGFFTEEDLAFEFDLAAASPHGFYRQRPFFYPPLQLGQPARVTEESPLQRRAVRAVENIRNMLADDMRSRGVPASQIQHWFDFAERERDEVEQRRWSYAAWLATSPQFRRQRSRLRSLWERGAADRESLPRWDFSFTGGSRHSAGGQSAEVDEAWVVFSRSWGIEGFATWDLPVPMRPEMAEPSLYPLPDVGGAGLLVFIPWYLLRDKEFDLHALARRQRLLNPATDLEDWLDSKPKNWGHQRYRVMLQLYFYGELCLRRRYADRVRGNLARLDIAFAKFLLADPQDKKRMSDESIRMIRKYLQQRLRSK